MPLTLITGRANAGKSGILHSALRDACERGEEATLLVPTQVDVRRASAEFAASYPIGIRVSTFPQWLETLWSRFGDGRILLRDSVRAAAIAAVIDRDGAEGLADSPGLRAVLGRLAPRCPVDPRVASPRDAAASGLARLIVRYRREVRAWNHVEPAEAARSLEVPDNGLGGPVGVNRFTDLEEWQVGLLLRMADGGADIRVALAYEPGYPPTEATQALAGQLASKAARVVRAQDESQGALHDLCDGLFQPAARTVSATLPVTFAEAGGPEAEAALIAQLAREHVEAGVDADRIAIAFRDPVQHARQVGLAMRAEGLDVDVQYAAPLGAQPLSVALITLVSAALERVDVPAAVSFVSSPYAGPVRAAAHEIDESLRRGRSRSSKDVLQAIASSGAWGSRTAELAHACAAEGSADLASWKKLASRLATRAAIERGGDLRDPDVARDARTLARISAVMDELATAPSPPAPPEVLAAIAGTTLREGIGDLPGAIQCLGLEDLRSRRFDVVIIGGLTATEFSSEQREPIVAQLAGRIGLSPGTSPSLVERQLFYLAVSRARKHLAFVRQSADERGDYVRPSAFWDEALNRVGLDPMECDLARSAVDYRRLDASAIAVASPSSTFGRREARVAATRGCGPTPQPRGVLDAEAAHALGERSEAFSATELEAWLACPYRWFLERVLRPRKLDREVDAAALGTLAHEVLAVFYKRWTAAGAKRVTQERLPSALALVDEVASRVMEERRIGSVSLADELDQARAIAQARRTVADDVEYLPGLVPSFFEQEFGVEQPFEFGGVLVRGRLDRIDVGPLGAVVTDYKMGGGGANWASWAPTGVIQMPLYAAVTQRLTGRPVLGGLYRSLRTGALKGFWDAEDAPASMGDAVRLGDDSGVAELIAHAEERASFAAAGIMSGDIGKRPRDKSSCTFCLLVGVCDRG